jgi:hypothetical protein
MTTAILWHGTPGFESLSVQLRLWSKFTSKIQAQEFVFASAWGK